MPAVSSGACNSLIVHRRLTKHYCFPGVVYHPKDESIAIMLNASADSINRTLTYSHRLSIDIISIKTNSAKDLLTIGNYEFMYVRSVT